MRNLKKLTSVLSGNFCVNLRNIGLNQSKLEMYVWKQGYIASMYNKHVDYLVSCVIHNFVTCDFRHKRKDL